MRNKILLLLAIISVCLSTNAQIKIDFNNDNNSNYNDANYTAWLIDNLEPSSGSLPSCERTFGNVAIKIQAVQDTIKIKHTWYKNMLDEEIAELYHWGGSPLHPERP